MTPSTSGPGMGLLPRVDGCDCHACRPEASYDQLDAETIATVLRHGWQVLLVGSGGCDCCRAEDADPPQEPDPAFAYTLGLGHRAGHPELVVSGLDPALMHSLLNRLAERVLAGRRFEAGEVLEGVLGHVPVVLARASPQGVAEAVPWSSWFHRRPVEALVVVWPSTSAVFAWQPGAPAVLDELQPPAWREPVPLGEALVPDPEWTFPVPPDTRAFSCRHVVEEARPVLWVARERDEQRGEDWTLHCGAAAHETDEIALLHLAHLVRGAPSLRPLATLPLDWEAERPDVDGEWTTRPLQWDHDTPTA